MGKVLLNITLLIVFLWIKYIYAIEESRTTKLQQIETILKGTCVISCLEKLKDEPSCERFCDFVPHLFDEHREEILEEYSKGSSTKSNSLSWSLDDVISWRIKKNWK